MLAEHYQPDNFETWWEQLGGDNEKIERTINHLHLWDVFEPAKEGVPDDALQQLAEVLAGGWRAALSQQFPGKAITVEVSTETEDYGPTLTVFANR